MPQGEDVRHPCETRWIDSRRPPYYPQKDLHREETAMTELLARALERLSELPAERQDDIAQKLLTELPGEAPREARPVPERVRRRSEADALNEACQQGWLTPPKAVSADPPPRHPVAPLQQLLDELRADRDGR